MRTFFTTFIVILFVFIGIAESKSIAIIDEMKLLLKDVTHLNNPEVINKRKPFDELLPEYTFQVLYKDEIGRLVKTVHYKNEDGYKDENVLLEKIVFYKDDNINSRRINAIIWLDGNGQIVKFMKRQRTENKEKEIGHITQVDSYYDGAASIVEVHKNLYEINHQAKEAIRYSTVTDVSGKVVEEDQANVMYEEFVCPPDDYECRH